MSAGTIRENDAPIDALLHDCIDTLQRVASYKLPASMDRRLTWLSENKEKLSPGEEEELSALVDFSEERTVEKLQAKVILRRLAEACPQLFGSNP